MNAWRCRLRGFYETVSLFVTERGGWYPVSGHSWPYPPVWGTPAPSPDEDWQGLVQFDESRCTRCGYVEEPPGWRVYYGPVG